MSFLAEGSPSGRISNFLPCVGEGGRQPREADTPAAAHLSTPSPALQSSCLRCCVTTARAQIRARSNTGRDALPGDGGTHHEHQFSHICPGEVIEQLLFFIQVLQQEKRRAQLRMLAGVAHAGRGPRHCPSSAAYLEDLDAPRRQPQRQGGLNLPFILKELKIHDLQHEVEKSAPPSPTKVSSCNPPTSHPAATAICGRCHTNNRIT